MFEYILLSIKWFFSNLNSITLLILILAFLASWYFQRKNASIGLESHILNASAAATIPTGVALIFCAFNLELVKSLEGFNINLCIAGLVVFFTAVKSTIKGIFA
ncbi:hypothetical protein ACI1G1_000316 [Vibrio cholerae]|nr:hypothetical protein [Vibrio cholerae]